MLSFSLIYFKFEFDLNNIGLLPLYPYLLIIFIIIVILLGLKINAKYTWFSRKDLNFVKKALFVFNN